MKVTSTVNTDGVVLIHGKAVGDNLAHIAGVIVGVHLSRCPTLAPRYKEMIAFYRFAMEQSTEHGSINVFDVVAWERIGGMLYITIGDESCTSPVKMHMENQELIAAAVANLRSQQEN